MALNCKFEYNNKKSCGVITRGAEMGIISYLGLQMAPYKLTATDYRSPPASLLKATLKLLISLKVTYTDKFIVEMLF